MNQVKNFYKIKIYIINSTFSIFIDLLKRLISEANSENVTFVYAISPGLDMVFTAEKEIKALESKLQQVSISNHQLLHLFTWQRLVGKRARL